MTAGRRRSTCRCARAPDRGVAAAIARECAHPACRDASTHGCAIGYRSPRAPLGAVVPAVTPAHGGGAATYRRVRIVLTHGADDARHARRTEPAERCHRG